LETSLRLLHPFMPFITEEIWQRLIPRLPKDEACPDSLMVAAYPTAGGVTDTQAEEEMGSVIEIIHSIRNARAQSRIEPARWIEAQIYTKNKSTIESHRQSIETLARVRPLAILDPRKKREDKEGALVLVLRNVEVILPMAVDLDAERQRLEKEKEALQAKIAHLETRLSDSTFLSKAPSLIIERERGKLLDSQGKLEKIEERLTQLC
jgi:valyl-tRNA synthetase